MAKFLITEVVCYEIEGDDILDADDAESVFLNMSRDDMDAACTGIAERTVEEE